MYLVIFNFSDGRLEKPMLFFEKKYSAVESDWSGLFTALYILIQRFRELHP